MASRCLGNLTPPWHSSSFLCTLPVLASSRLLCHQHPVSCPEGAAPQRWIWRHVSCECYDSAEATALSLCRLTKQVLRVMYCSQWHKYTLTAFGCYWYQVLVCIGYSLQRWAVIWLKSRQLMHPQNPRHYQTADWNNTSTVNMNSLPGLMFFLWLCLIPASRKNMSAAVMYLVVYFSDQGKAESQQSLNVPSSLSLSLTLSECEAGLHSLSE